MCVRLQPWGQILCNFADAALPMGCALNPAVVGGGNNGGFKVREHLFHYLARALGFDWALNTQPSFI